MKDHIHRWIERDGKIVCADCGVEHDSDSADENMFLDECSG